MGDIDVEQGLGDTSDIQVDKLMSKVGKLQLGDDKTNESFEKDETWGNIPINVRRRIAALRKNQSHVMKVESEFYKELRLLENKYQGKFHEVYRHREALVNGLVEPSDEDCDFPGGNNHLLLEQKQAEGVPDTVQGVPFFWATVFQTSETLSSVCGPADIPILQHLKDVRAEATENPTGFKLFFHFAPNEFFSDEVLTKTYRMSYDVDPTKPLSFEGPEIVSCEGCEIHWKPDVNILRKVVEKRQRNRRTGEYRVVKEEKKLESFFHFFSPPEVEDESKELDEDVVETLNEDFELGHYFRERIIPRAVMYFTCEIHDEDEDDEDEEDSELSSSADDSSSDDNDSEEEENNVDNDADDNNNGVTMETPPSDEHNPLV